MEDEPLPSKYLLAPPWPRCLAGREEGQGGGTRRREGELPRLRKSQDNTWKTGSPAHEEWWDLSSSPNWAGLWLGLWWKWGSVRPGVQALVPKALLSLSVKTPCDTTMKRWNSWLESMNHGAGRRPAWPQPREQGHQILRGHMLPSHISSHSAGKWLLPWFSNVQNNINKTHRDQYEDKIR